MKKRVLVGGAAGGMTLAVAAALAMSTIPVRVEREPPLDAMPRLFKSRPRKDWEQRQKPKHRKRKKQS